MNRTFIAVLTLGMLSAFAWRATSPTLPEKENMEALQVAIQELLPSALEQEEAERETLLKETRKRSERVSEFLEGTPTEIQEAKERLLETSQAFEKAVAPLRASAEAASRAIETAAASVQEHVGSMGLHRTGARCGEDGCGGECKPCPLDELCLDLFCHCVPACDNKTCGSDGCGGRCGTGICGDGQRCDDAGQCVAREQEEICTPNCRKTPEGPRMQEIMGPRDRGVSRKGAGFRPHDTRDEAARIRDLLTDKSTELESQTRAHRARSAKIRELKEDQIPSLQETLKALNETLDRRGKELNSAAVKDPAAQNALEVLSQKVVEATRAMKDTRKALSMLQKAHARDERSMTSLVDAERRLSAEAGRLSAHLLSWDAAMAELETSRTAQSQAIQDAKSPLMIHATTWEPRISTVQAEVTRLEGKSLKEVELHWEDDGPTSVVSPRILRLPEANPLSRYQTGVRRLHQKYKNWWASAPPAIRDEHPDWERKVAELEGLLIYLDELNASTTRMVELRNALLNARAQSSR